jgi:Protein of unknown function (DUF3775)
MGQTILICLKAGCRWFDMAQSGVPVGGDAFFDAVQDLSMMVTAPTLSISPEKVCFFALKAREFDVKDVVTDPDSGSNASDDAMISVLEDHPDDPTHQELRSFIDALTEDEQVDLVALTWLGRGDGTIDEWDDLRQEAARLHNKPHGRLSAREADAGRPSGRGAFAIRLFLRGLPGQLDLKQLALGFSGRARTW